MAEHNIGVIHRLLGEEDVEFDNKHTNEKTTFTSPFGTTHTLTKVNAKSIPLDNASYLAFLSSGNISNISEALQHLLSITGGGNEPGAIGIVQDTVIDLIPEEGRDNCDVFQSIINNAGHILNGHTLTFKLPDNLSNVSLTSSLSFSNFRGGKLIIDLNGANLELSASGVNGAMVFTDCMCLIEVNGGVSSANKGGVIHNNNNYGIYFDRCPAAQCIDLSFNSDDSTQEGSRYGVFAVASTVKFSGCSVLDDQYYSEGVSPASAGMNNWTGLNGGLWLTLMNRMLRIQTNNQSTASQVISLLKPSYLNKLKYYAIANKMRLDQSKNFIVAEGTVNGCYYQLYRSGKLSMRGSFITASSPFTTSPTSRGRLNRVDLPFTFANTNYSINLTQSLTNHTASITLTGDAEAKSLAPSKASEGAIYALSKLYCIVLNQYTKQDYFYFLSGCAQSVSLANFSANDIDDILKYDWEVVGDASNATLDELIPQRNTDPADEGYNLNSDYAYSLGSFLSELEDWE